MADTKTVQEVEAKAPYQLTWRDKTEQGKPLNDYDKIKRDAEILTLRRIRDNQEDQQLRNDRHSADSVRLEDLTLAEVDADLSVKTNMPENSKKGN